MATRKKQILDREYLDLIKNDDDREAIETLLYMNTPIAVGKRLPKPTPMQEFRTDPINLAKASTDRLKLRTDKHAVFVKTGINVDAVRFRFAEGSQQTLDVVKEHLGVTAGQLAIGEDVEFLVPSVKGISFRGFGIDWQSLDGHTRIPPTKIQVMDITSPKWIELPSQTGPLIPNYLLHFTLQSNLHDYAVEQSRNPDPKRSPLPGDAWTQPTKLMVEDLRDYWTSTMSIIDRIGPKKFLEVAAFSAGLYLPDLGKAHSEIRKCLIALIEKNTHFSHFSFSEIDSLISQEMERGCEWKYHGDIPCSDFSIIDSLISL